MADLRDCENAIIDAIATFLVPDGASYRQDVPFTTNLGDAVRIGRLFAPQNVVAADVSAGTQELDLDGRVVSQQCASGAAPAVQPGDTAEIIVQAASGMCRDETRHARQWARSSTLPLTLTATVSGSTVSFAGAGGAGQVTGIGYDRMCWCYRVGASDTPASVAAALAALIPGAVLDGASVRVTNLGPVVARVVSDAVLVEETGRRGQVFRITVLAPSPDIRDDLGNAVEVIMGLTRLFVLPDGSTTLAPVFNGSFHSEASEDGSLWRRDLTYRLEYSITATQQVPLYLFGSQIINTVQTLYTPS